MDRESLIAEVDGPEILVIPKCAAKPSARAGDALRGAEEELPLEDAAEPDTEEACCIAAGDFVGIVIGGVDGDA